MNFEEKLLLIDNKSVTVNKTLNGDTEESIVKGVVSARTTQRSAG